MDLVIGKFRPPLAQLPGASHCLLLSFELQSQLIDHAISFGGVILVHLL
jgi:hypothetical protein